MTSNLFIPDKIRVGYRNRSDTYNGKLAYVIYYDNKGKLRKERSWDSWRDHKIEPETIDNEPISGFVLNKNIERYNWSHFGSGRSYIRVYDPRGIEFEITPENLMALLLEGSCSKRYFEGEFVYAWVGGNHVLLPVDSESYKESRRYTNLQSKKFSARDLKVGHSYTTKKQEEVVYVGRYEWFEYPRSEYVYYRQNSRNGKERKGKKHHIFYQVKDGESYNVKGYGKVLVKSGASFIAHENTDEPVVNFAEILDEVKQEPCLSSTLKPVLKRFKSAEKYTSSTPVGHKFKDNYCHISIDEKSAYQIRGDNIDIFEIVPRTSTIEVPVPVPADADLQQRDLHRLANKTQFQNVFSGYSIIKKWIVNTKTWEVSSTGEGEKFDNSHRRWGYNNYNRQVGLNDISKAELYDEAQLEDELISNYGKVKIKLDNGKEVSFDKIFRSL